MSNYYTISTTFVPGAKVRSDEVNAELTGISAGFDYLPADANAIKEGKAYRGTEGGTGNSYTVTMDDTRTAYADGDRVSFKATHTNTGAATINLDSVGNVALVDANGAALTAGDITSGRWYEAVYIAASNHFQLLSVNTGLLTDVATQVGYAQEWATKAEDSLISTAAGGDGATDYSALHWAAKAAADAVSTAADAVSTAADAAATAADAIATAADAVSTAADVVSSGNNVTYAAEWAVKAEDSLISVAAGGDGSTDYSALHWAAKAAASAAAALVSEGLADGYATSANNDAAATAADLVQTNLDQISCAADAVSTAADAVSTAADVVTTGNNVTYAAEWAVKAEDSLISVAAGGDGSTDYSALHWAAKAAASAASINLPTLSASDPGKILEVNATYDGYDLTARAASETATGFVELATNAEVTTGTDTSRAITPAGLQQKTASETALGIVELATDAEALAMSDTSRAVVPSSMYAALQTFPRKNRIINGCMRIWSWGQTTWISAANNSWPLDRFRYVFNCGAVVNISQNTLSTPVNGFVLNTILSPTTADTSIAAGEYGGYVYKIEGTDIVDFKLGTSNAEKFTLSFWHAHTKTGTHSVSFRNADNSRSYTAEYTQSVADTWEKAEITVQGDTSGTWLYGSSEVGLNIHFCHVVGSTFQATAGSWNTGNYLGTANQVNNYDNTANYMRFAQVQLELGPQATDFEHRLVTHEKVLAGRYHQRLPSSVASNVGSLQTTTSATGFTALPYPLRSTPSLTTTVGDHRVRVGTTNKTPTAVSVQEVTTNGVTLDWTIAASTQYDVFSVRSNNAALDFDCEL